MPNSAPAPWNGSDAVLVETYDATDLLGAPFKVLLEKSVKQVVDENGVVVETIIPDPEGLMKAVALCRVLHSHKLSAVELRFLRSSLGMKSKEFARAIRVTPEHMSRLESGDKVLTPQTEMLVRIFTFVQTLPFTTRKEAEATQVASLVGNVFGDLSIQPCHAVEDRVVLTLVRVHRELAGDPRADSGLWDENLASKAA